MKHRPIRHRVEYLLFLTASKILARLPHDMVRRVGGVLGAVAYRLDRAHRAIALTNLARTFPELDDSELERAVISCYRHFGTAFCEVFSASRFSREDLESRFHFEGWQHVEAALRTGRGIMFLGGHFGSFQIAMYPLSARLGGLHVVVRPTDNPYVNRESVRMRERFGVTVLSRARVGYPIVSLLRHGRHVGLVIDQRPPPKTGTRVTFLGRPCRTSEVPAIAAVHTRALAVPTACLPIADGQYVVRFRPAVEPEPEGHGATNRLMRSYLSAVEADILEHPALWFWMHDRWKPGMDAEDKMRALRKDGRPSTAN
jgi:KDO2-lipid IV(A) lauroyltransferase